MQPTQGAAAQAKPQSDPFMPIPGYRHTLLVLTGAGPGGSPAWDADALEREAGEVVEPLGHHLVPRRGGRQPGCGPVAPARHTCGKVGWGCQPVTLQMMCWVTQQGCHSGHAPMAGLARQGAAAATC